MANKQGPGFVDKHIEKVILGVCGLILIYAVVRYGVSTPRRIEVVKGDPAVPAEVDSILLKEAQRVRSLVESEDPPKNPELTYAEQFRELETSPLADQFVSISFGVPLFKGLGYGGVVPTKAPTLEGIRGVIPAPHKPVNWCESELVNVSGDKNEIKLKESPTWRSVTYYPWGKLTEAWTKELKDSVIYPQLTVVGYEVQIEEKQLDGTWKLIDSVKPVHRLVLDKNGDEILPPHVPPYQVSEDKTTDNTAQINDAVSSLSSWAESLLQPDYFDIWTSEGRGAWQKHMPLKTIASWYKGYWESPGENEKTGGKSTKTKTTGKKGVKTTRRRPADLRIAPGMPGIAPGMPGMPGMGPGMGPGINPTMTRRRGTSRRLAGRYATAGSKLLPDYDTQLEAGKVLVWFHSDKIKYGHEYRSRFRLIFVNPLLTFVDDVDKSKPQDAKIPTITTKWSPWSDPVEVARNVQFFVTGSSANSKTIAVTIFTKVLGQLVSGHFGHIGVGDPIGGTAQVAVINPATGETDEPRVAFNTGAIAVSLNFQKEVVILTRTGRYTKKTTEIVYMDRDGKLHSRVMYDDKRSKTYKAMRDEVKEKAPMTERERILEEKRLERLREKKREKSIKRRTPGGSPLGPGMVPGVGPGMGPGAFPGGMPGAAPGKRR